MLWNAKVTYEIQPHKLEAELEKTIQVVKALQNSDTDRSPA